VVVLSVLSKVVVVVVAHNDHLLPSLPLPTCSLIPNHWGEEPVDVSQSGLFHQFLSLSFASHLIDGKTQKKTKGGEVKRSLFDGCLIRGSHWQADLHNSAGRAGNTGPQIGALLSHRSGNGGTLHLTLGVHDHASVVLEINEHTILSPEGLPLPDDDGGGNWREEEKHSEL
jgi:hypothetical protein